MKKVITAFLLGLVVLSTSISVMADDSGLAVGAQAPEIVGVNKEGETFTLSERYAQKPVVLIFYRGGWCPYCNYQLQMFEKQINAFQERGVDVVAVSVDNLAEVKKMVDGKSYGIELAKSDPEKYKVEEMGYTFDIVGKMSVDVLKAYNAVEQIDDVMAEKYLEWGIDLEASSGETHHIIAIPATYVIDTNGEIVFAESDRDYAVRTLPKDVLSFLDKPKG